VHLVINVFFTEGGFSDYFSLVLNMPAIVSILIRLPCYLNVVRWLTEYGFLMHDGRPERYCHSWNLTVADVLSVAQAVLEPYQSISSSSSGSSSNKDALTLPSPYKIAAAVSRLQGAGLKDWHTATLDGTGTIHTSLVKWVSVAVGNLVMEEKHLGQGMQTGVDGQEALALRLLCRPVHRQHLDLRTAAKAASESLRDKAVKGSRVEGTETVRGPAGAAQPSTAKVVRAHQEMLLSVLKGSVIVRCLCIQILGMWVHL
jgi:hypothetical protein